jgi:hypothetical protein
MPVLTCVYPSHFQLLTPCNCPSVVSYAECVDLVRKRECYRSISQGEGASSLNPCYSIV